MLLPASLPPPELLYQHPGADPYLGTLEEATELLSAPAQLSPQALIAIEHSGYCRIRNLRQNELLLAMTHGRNHISYNVRVDLASWPNSASTLVSECTDGLGNAILLPEVCGNYSFEKISPFPYYNAPPGWSASSSGSENGSSSNEEGESGESGESEENGSGNSGSNSGSRSGEYTPANYNSNASSNTNSNSNSNSSAISNNNTIPSMIPSPMPIPTPIPTSEPSSLITLLTSLILLIAIKKGKHL
jgi:hypothetical protein